MKDKVISAILGFLAGIACVTASGCTVEVEEELGFEEQPEDLASLCSRAVWVECYCKGPDEGDTLCSQGEILSKLEACMSGQRSTCWGDFVEQEDDGTTSWYCEDGRGECS